MVRQVNVRISGTKLLSLIDPIKHAMLPTMEINSPSYDFTYGEGPFPTQ
jgi:hypothetical protein